MVPHQVARGVSASASSTLTSMVVKTYYCVDDGMHPQMLGVLSGSLFSSYAFLAHTSQHRSAEVGVCAGHKVLATTGSVPAGKLDDDDAFLSGRPSGAIADVMHASISFGAAVGLTQSGPS